MLWKDKMTHYISIRLELPETDTQVRTYEKCASTADAAPGRLLCAQAVTAGRASSRKNASTAALPVVRRGYQPEFKRSDGAGC
jgi:hypothetical protein